MLKALLTDIDGTITDSSRRLNTDAIIAIRSLVDNGVEVVLASGNTACFMDALCFGDDFLTTQPLPRNYYNIIRSAPAVNIDYTASSGSAMLAYGGTTEGQNACTLDGVNVADAGAGQHWILPAIQWFEEIQVAGLGAPAEYGGFTGAIINGVTKSGGNEFHGELELYYQPASWTADNDPENPDEEFKFFDAALSLGGPVVKDKLWYFASLEYWNQVTTPYGALDTSDREIPRFLGKLTWQASDASRVMAMVEYEFRSWLKSSQSGAGAGQQPGSCEQKRSLPATLEGQYANHPCENGFSARNGLNDTQ